MALLIGVTHCEEYTGRVIRRLSHENLENKKVMLEMPSYPLECMRRAISSSFANFFDGIASYALEQKGILVFGEDPILFERAVEKKRELSRLIHDLWEDYEKRYDKYEKNGWRYGTFDKEKIEAAFRAETEKLGKEEKPLREKLKLVPFEERDLHFAKVVAEQKPDIIILGYKHMPYLIEHCFSDDNYSLIRIPPDSLLKFMKEEWG
ncbi:MAG: hypothetical protein WC852_07360 [Candidatus Nanoarchaeia archaeon]|jgi:hypothetical protein